MKRFLYILPIAFLLAGCQVKESETEGEQSTEEVTLIEESITEETTEEVIEKNSMTDEQVEAFNNLNFSTTLASYVTDYKSQYAIAYEHNKLTSIHPIIGGREDITNYDEFELHSDKGYLYVTPTTDKKTANYVKIGEVMVNIPNESVFYFSEPADIKFKGVRIQSISKEGFLNVPVYTADGIMHNDGFETSKYLKADISIPNIDIEDANTFNPLIFDLTEPEKLDIGFDGSITTTYTKAEEKSFYLYNDSEHSDSGSNYIVYKDDEVLYKSNLPGGCRMFVDFNNYDKIEICCGLLVPTK